MNRKAVVLLSGGIDSTVTLYWAKEKGFDCSCLIFDYGQRHRREIQAAKIIAEMTGCPAEVIKFSLPWGGSVLLGGQKREDRSQKTEVRSRKSEGAGKENIPATYVPARNTIFLSFALSFAEVIGAGSIFIGANAMDYNGYPDCRPEYYEVYEELIKIGTRLGVEERPIKIQTPLINKTKAEIISLGMRLKVPFEQTWSCYEGGELLCGKCDACLLRAKGFSDAGIKEVSRCRRP